MDRFLLPPGANRWTKFDQFVFPFNVEPNHHVDLRSIVDVGGIQLMCVMGFQAMQ